MKTLNYSKEKIKNKKEKIDLTNQNKEIFDSIPYKFSKCKTIEQFLNLCKEKNISIDLKKSKKDEILNAYEIIKNNIFSTSINKLKNDNELNLFELLSKKSLNSRHAVFPSDKKDYADIVLMPFQKDVIRYSKSIQNIQVIILQKIICNYNYAIRDFNDFVFSKNRVNDIERLYKFLFFKYDNISNLELFFSVLSNDESSFYRDSSFKKQFKKFSEKNNLPLNNRQIHKIKSYGNIFLNKQDEINNDVLANYIKEFLIFDIVNDEYISKALSNENNSELLFEYCHYVKNKILVDSFFEKKNIKPLYDYILHKKNQMIEKLKSQSIETNNKSIDYKNSFHLKQHEPHILLEEMISWHNGLSKSKLKEYKEWDRSSKIENYVDEKEFVDENGVKVVKFIKIVELTNNIELIKEGKELKHCVASYSGRCINNGTRIFSLKIKETNQLKEKSHATIQVVLEKNVIQCRGYKNNEIINDNLKNIIKKWMNNNNLVDKVF